VGGFQPPDAGRTLPTAVGSVVADGNAQLAKDRVIRSKCAGSDCSTRTSPPVMAPEGKESDDLVIVAGDGEGAAVQFLDAGDAQHARGDPSIRAPMRSASCRGPGTCGSLAALINVDSPSASTAAMTKFSVAVTDI